MGGAGGVAGGSGEGGGFSFHRTWQTWRVIRQSLCAREELNANRTQPNEYRKRREGIVWC